MTQKEALEVFQNLSQSIMMGIKLFFQQAKKGFSIEVHRSCCALILHAKEKFHLSTIHLTSFSLKENNVSLCIAVENFPFPLPVIESVNSRQNRVSFLRKLLLKMMCLSNHYLS